MTDVEMRWMEGRAMLLLKRYGLFDQGWRFEWGRSVRAAGFCYYPSGGRRGVIRVSRACARLNPYEVVMDTLLHELAHALVGPGHGHDAVWRAMCAMVGARPERNFDSDPEWVVNRPAGKWKATCQCGLAFERHRKPRLERRLCTDCKRPLRGLRWDVADQS